MKRISAILLVMVLITMASGNIGVVAYAESSELSKLTIMGPTDLEGNGVEEWEKYGTYHAMMDLFTEAGLELEFKVVAREQYATTVQTQMAAGINLPDIAHIGDLDATTALNLGYQGTIIDVTPYIDQYSNGNIKAFLDDYDFANKVTVAPDGAQYWFVGVSRFIYESTGEITQSTLAQQYRLDWAENLGIDNPTTTQEFYDMLVAFREQDANGDGMQNEIMIADPSTFANGIAPWFGLGLDLTYADPNTGLVVSPWLSEGIEEYIAYMQSLYDAGVLSLDMVGASSEMINQKLYSNCTSSTYGYTVLAPENSMEDEFNAKYCPAGPLDAGIGVTSYVTGEVSEITLQKYAITRDCKDIEAAIRFFDVVYSDEYCLLQSWGREGYEFEYGEDGLKHLTEAYGAWNRDTAMEGDNFMLLGRSISDTVFPRTQLLSAETQVDGIQDYKRDWQLKYGNYEDMVYFSADLYALPDTETTTRKSELLLDLTTYSEESLAKLCTGEMNIDQLENVIQTLKDMGLEELLAINQKLFDRYNSL